jgi:hypothetical protein
MDHARKHDYEEGKSSDKSLAVSSEDLQPHRPVRLTPTMTRLGSSVSNHGPVPASSLQTIITTTHPDNSIPVTGFGAIAEMATLKRLYIYY